MIIDCLRGADLSELFDVDDAVKSALSDFDFSDVADECVAKLFQGYDPHALTGVDASITRAFQKFFAVHGEEAVQAAVNAAMARVTFNLVPAFDIR